MENTIKKILSDSASLKSKLASDSDFVARVGKAAAKVIATKKAGGTIYSCGNGGSTCDAMHLTEELVARYKRERAGIRAMHLMDPSVMTCWSNDYEYEGVFERQVRTFCGKNDLFIGISTSGNSKNILRAFAAAKELGTYTIGLTGKTGGAFPKSCDLSLIVSSNETERIQEVHITLIHIFCELLETT